MFLRKTPYSVLLLFLSLTLGLYPKSALAETLRYKVSARMWVPEAVEPVPTPDSALQRIERVFELWTSVPKAPMEFKFVGLSAEHYTLPHEIPRDGILRIVLDSDYLFEAPAAHRSRCFGQSPDHYEGGYVFLNVREGLEALSFPVLAHEIGHALGIVGHSPAPAALMNAEGPTWKHWDVRALTEQDQALWVDAWKPEALYRISGRVETGQDQRVPVHAVHVVNGRTYSTRCDAGGAFEILVMRPGRYRLFAKGYESGTLGEPVSQSPSWYMSPGKSTNDPYLGTPIHLSSSTRRIEGVLLAMIDEAPPFSFWETEVEDISAAFLRGGRSAAMKLLYSDGKIRSVEPYGLNPDYTVRAFDPVLNEITVMAKRDADPGHRLFIARGAKGMVQAGLLGVHLVEEPK
ncbi:MAG: hypothetical protein JW937_09080 [Candidatus Omnitrophica bacterium]|nr:hypothetical protein [Candidatus Omnitrophota bacterium]